MRLSCTDTLMPVVPMFHVNEVLIDGKSAGTVSLIVWG